MSDLAWRPQPFGWLTQAVWAPERAFKKGRAAEQAESDTRLRIFFLLALFATGRRAPRAALAGRAGSG